MRPVTRSPFRSVMTSVLALSEAPASPAAKAHNNSDSRPSARQSPVRLKRRPAVVGVELFDGRGHLFRVLAQISLPHHAVLIDDESHDTTRPISCRVREYGKAAREPAVAEIALGSPGRLWSVRGQNAIEVTMVRPPYALRAANDVAVGTGRGQQRSGGTRRLSRHLVPEQPILLAG